MELVSPGFVNAIALCAAIGGLSLGIWWAIGLYAVHDRKSEKELPDIELPGHIHEVISGIPPVLIAFFAFIGISLVLYVVYIWLGGLTY